MIILDPGHGGKDPGAVGFEGILEKHVNLIWAHAIRGLLVDHVSMTREDDSTLLLAERIRPCDLFVSIHCNSNEGTPGKGFEVFYGPQLASLSLAESIADGWSLTNVRGVKDGARFYVLRKSLAPAAVLIELGFVNNPVEASLLMNPSFVKQGSMAIARGIEQALYQAVS
jgi:N-acetylmuramoyl-L-alanine amidase